MELILSFAAGVVACGLALPAMSWARGRIARYRQATDVGANQVTTVSQVLHLAVQGSPTALTVLDRSQEIVMSNPAAHEMSLVHDRAVNPEVWETAQEVFEDKETRTVDIAIPKRRTGHRVTQVRAVIKPLTLNDGRFVIVYGTDESENVRMESARRDFVANVSHELKTPVGGIALLAEALLQDPGDQETVEYFGNKVYKEANRMADMVSELISLSKLQGAEALPEMEPLAVDDLIDEALSRNHLAAEARSIELNRGASVGVQVKGDRSLLVTALSNLVSNAINYSPEKMPVSVSQKVVDGGVVLIRVTDRGIGIAPDDQKRVFERFFRVDQARSRQTGGTGLGLAIVKHVVANHGGNIKLWSRPGTGSTFTIELPIYREEKPAQEAGMKDNEKRDAVDAAAPGLPRAVARVAARRKDKAQ
ncbi:MULTISPECIES: sensor histidine kinase [Corynebacterium]|uniref:sensor histidine kinase n=1 Tax=Corynebacterium TaxID=1716 RepID=UPI00190680DA|nr:MULTISPECIES: ATP-binding protein [Corynebacterium]MCG7241769.1 ATP-binding protein [Corynebacterium kefirresidentii]MCG7284074.1 ATP-binding protein [Corynebacterium kefirresidentii]MCG7449492.1 ATP-binding protein [Corynebacterium kefirresidentii]MCG7452408.1 ATP-binding protein [Corynebacterium kefirresidentii]MCK6082686.1 sensor histidine kinase [Corynebacterium kefirresidentii]